MPQEVTAAALGDAGHGEVLADLATQPVRAQRGARGGEKELVGKMGRDEPGPDDLGVQAHPEQGPLPDGHVAVLGAFAPAHKDGAAFEVQVPEPQRDEFAAAQGTGVEDLQHGPVPQAEGPRHVRGTQESGHLRRAQGGFGKPPVGPGHEEIGGRIDGDPVSTAQPGKELVTIPPLAGHLE